MKINFLTNEDYQNLDKKINDKLDTIELESAIETALFNAKASGEFDGAKGETGYTPVKGVDYFTETDKAELITNVLEELTKGRCLLLAKQSLSK